MGLRFFRHEVAFVFGQLCHPASVPCLKTCLARGGEMSMVRHEAAEALGSLGEVDGVEEFLRGFWMILSRSLGECGCCAGYGRGRERV